MLHPFPQWTEGEAVCKHAPPSFYSLSHLFEITSLPEYLSDFHAPSLFVKMVTGPTGISMNINVFVKENLEQLAVEKCLFSAEIYVNM